MVFKKLFVNTCIHTSDIIKKKRDLTINNNVYESGTEDLCTDLCIITLYTAVWKICICIYIVLEREAIIKDGE